MTKPNILFFFADDMRYDTIAALGNSEIITPNLDKLVNSGTSFSNAHIPGGTNAAVCMPSRAMLNTGRFLFSIDEEGARISEDHVLLGEALQKAGYETYGTGKWHNGYKSYARSFTDGAEIYFGGMYDHWKVPAYSFDPTGKYSMVINDVMNPSIGNRITYRRTDHVTMGKHSSDLFAEATAQWIENYNSDKPFYAYISYLAPHDPRTMPQKYLDMYNKENISIPENFLSEHPFNYGMKDIRDEMLEKYPREKEAIRTHLHEYYAMITHLDDTVGQVIESLKKSGKYENTIIIFASDNGLALGQHGLMGKQNNYEHSIRVPFVISGSGIPKGEIRDSFVYLCDLFPTICELIHIEIPKTVEGISFKEVIHDDKVHIRDRIYAAFEDKIRSIKDHKYKLIAYKYENLRETQLFDLENDPYEMRNLFYDKAYYPVVKKLRKELKVYAKKTGDTLSEQGINFWNDTIRVKKRVYVPING